MATKGYTSDWAVQDQQEIRRLKRRALELEAALGRIIDDVCAERENGGQFRDAIDRANSVLRGGK